MERFNLKKLNNTEGSKQYSVQISNGFAALENTDAEVDIHSAWETIGDNLGYFELKYKPWFDKGCTKLLDQRKQAVVTGYSYK
jgi:hypothetical protein